MSGKVSAVIPVYNTPDEFLVCCVESLCNQTYRNTEIILVDDGSKKQTADLCDRLAENDNRVVVLHCENQGPSAARNLGMEYATGEYLTFVDSDDTLVPEAWSICVEKLDAYNGDCLVFGWIDNSKGHPEMMKVTDADLQELTAKDAMIQIAGNNEACGGGYPWNKFWRRSALLEAHGSIPLFDRKLFAYEDKEWILRSLIGLKKVLLISNVLYDYRYVESSLTNKADGWEKRQYNAYYAYDRILEILKPVNYDAYRSAVNFYFRFGFMDLYTQLQHPSWFGGWKRVRKTKKHMYWLCRKVRFSDLKGYKRKCLWLLMLFWGIV